MSDLEQRLDYLAPHTDMAVYGDIEANVGDTCREAADRLRQYREFIETVANWPADDPSFRAKAMLAARTTLKETTDVD